MKRSDLIEVIYSANLAIKRVLDHWQKGDLAAAIRELEAVNNNEIEPAIEWWESEAT
ncbi:hypothetical protein ACTG4Q_20890 [Bradyrhizobium denitrificans]